MIEALGKTTKEAGKAYVKYNSELTSIQTDETLTTTEKYSKIEALDKKYFTEVLEASKRTNTQKSEDVRLFSEISTRSETQLQEQISNIKTSYVNSNSKTQAKADKDIAAETIKETKATLAAQIKLIDGYNDEQIAQKTELQKKLLATEYSDVADGDTANMNDVQFAKYIEYLDKIQDLDDAAAMAKAKHIENLAEREKQINLLSAEKTYKDDLKLAGDSESAKLAAFVKFNDEKTRIEQEYAQKSSAIYKTTNAALSAFLEAFRMPEDDGAAERRAEAQKEIDEKKAQYKTEENELEKSRARQEMSFKDYLSKSKALQKKHNDEIAELQKKLEKDTLGDKFVSSINSGLSAASASIAAESKKNFADAYSKRKSYSDASVALDKKIASIEDKNNEERKKAVIEKEKIDKQATEATTQMYLDSAVQIGAAGLQALAEGKNVGKAFVLMAFDQMMAMVPIWTTSIIGVETASKGIIGLITSAAGNCRFDGGCSRHQSPCNGGTGIQNRWLYWRGIG